jgi:2-polyprenyl-3-methyl-5-hydroxy-6-metoxy-1,4-benzoquinol methylase
MHSRDELERALDDLKQKYGDWTYDIPLPFEVWTRGNLQVPHTRLKRIVQVVSDLSVKQLSQSRILDLGCLDGIFSIEFAKQGANTLGIEIREANIKKALFCKEALGLHNLEFRQDDVRNVTVESYGSFDAIICSGILYHLEASDAINLIQAMYHMVNRLVVIDTHVALRPVVNFVQGGEQYWGSVFREHSDDATREEKAKKLWASAENPTSFWFTRPSLVNVLSNAGFSSVYECFIPAHLNFGKPGLEHRDRCTFVAVKGTIRDLVTSPSANSLREQWQEGGLTYAPVLESSGRPPFRQMFASRLRRMLGLRFHDRGRR